MALAGVLVATLGGRGVRGRPGLAGVAPEGGKDGEARRWLRQNYMSAGQTIQKPHQIAACLHLFYLLFTRKSEGQRWRRMLRSADGACAGRISASATASREQRWPHLA